MLWVDNFNKFRYSRNPDEDRDQCINATVYALLPLPTVSPLVHRGWVGTDVLSERMASFGRVMQAHHRQAIDRVRTLVLQGLQYDQVRVPCDLRRYGVTTMPWRPLQVLPADIKSTEGLVDAILGVLKIQQDTAGVCCMLMDVNIFWRTLRLVYTQTNSGANVAGTLHNCLPVLGIWHAYAHCCKKVYQYFLPWWACLEIPGFLRHPESSTVYTRPRLIVIEHLAMAVFLVSAQVEKDIRRTAADVERVYVADSPQAHQVNGLLMLVTEYCPALVDLGISVRQCFWKTQDSGTGLIAREVLRDAIVLLQGLKSKKATEYMRNLCIMDMLWSDIHSDIPAAAYVEECLESSLSVLTRRMRTDTRANSVKLVSDVYSYVPSEQFAFVKW